MSGWRAVICQIESVFIQFPHHSIEPVVLMGYFLQENKDWALQKVIDGRNHGVIG